MALAAATVAAMPALTSQADNDRGKKKTRRKHQGKKRCRRQVAPCKAFFSDLCSADPDCEAAFFPCCDSLASCDSAGMLQCLFFCGCDELNDIAENAQTP